MSNKLKKGLNFDVLGDILETLRFRSSIFFYSDLAAPWGMSLSKEDFLRFHIALSGECIVGTDGPDTVIVSESDIIMLPCGNSHWISDKPGRKLIPSERAGNACNLNKPLFQKGKITNRLMCGLVKFDTVISHPVISALPEIMHFPMIDRSGPIWSVISLIDSELSRHNDTGNRIINRLTEVLFLQLLKNYITENDNASLFLSALNDRRIHHALSLMHQKPEFNWSLSSLGEQVGMSRSTLVRRFQEVLGVTPMAYLTDWRVMKAYNLIKDTIIPLEKIAETTGFASARTLNKTFQQHYGCTPRKLRQLQNL
ncbi:MAG: AraC family transcriptional regulator [Gammaproteobacteria bacterium]